MSRTVAGRFRAVQVRTTAVAMATVMVVLVVGAVGVLRLFERQEVHQVDATLDRAAEFIHGAIASPQGLSGAPSPDDLAQVVDGRGHVVYATDRLRGLPPAIDPSAGAPTGHRTRSLSGVGRVRAIAIPFNGNSLVLMSSLSGVDEAVSSLRVALALAVPVLALGIAVIVWFVVGRTLRPVRSTIEREERLVADVTHELRSPLAGIRALLETEGREPAEIELNRHDALASLDRLDALTDGLLAVARQEGNLAVEAAPLLDLDELVVRAVDRLVARPGVAVDLSAVIAGQVRGNESDLERVVANLLSNAQRHAASTVRVTVHEVGDRVELRVADDGPGIAPADRERIFDRFTRLDDARSRDRGGAGLGLSIVRAVVATHGGTVTVGASAEGGAELIVSLPRGDARPRYAGRRPVVSESSGASDPHHS